MEDRQDSIKASSAWELLQAYLPSFGFSTVSFLGFPLSQACMTL